jgi:hypothetical protein
MTQGEKGWRPCTILWNAVFYYSVYSIFQEFLERHHRSSPAISKATARTRSASALLPPRRSSRSRSIITFTFATIQNAFSATSAWRPAAGTLRTPSPSPSPGGVSPLQLPRNLRSHCPNPHAFIAATAFGVCPTGALMFKSEYDMRQAGTWDESRQQQTTTVCPYCGVGCNLTVHAQDGEIVKVTSPLDHSVTQGNLCIKGRFGWQFVQIEPSDKKSKRS